jgi:dsRNA-specific ribonuclease
MKNELLGEGTGKTKKEAEQSAAKKAMEKIQE